MTLPTTKQIQRALIEAQFLAAVDPVTLLPADDGDFGVNTQTAIKNYEAAHGLPMIGSQWTPAFLASLFPPPPKAPNPITDFFTGIAIQALLNSLKGSPLMSFLSGYKTYVIGVAMILLGLILLIGWTIPSIPLDQSQGIPLIMAGIGLITGRTGAKQDVAKALGGNQP